MNHKQEEEGLGWEFLRSMEEGTQRLTPACRAGSTTHISLSCAVVNLWFSWLAAQAAV